MTHSADTAPWYRQPWFWFVMSPLIVVVCVSLTFVGISLYHADDRVVDNYYQHGRTINQSFEQEARARELALVAQLRFDQTSGEVWLSLESHSGGDEHHPEQLHLQIGHPVNAERDQRVMLRKVRGGEYRGDLDSPLEHRRYLTLMPAAGAGDVRAAEWLLRGELRADHSGQVELRPREADAEASRE